MSDRYTAVCKMYEPPTYYDSERYMKDLEVVARLNEQDAEIACLRAIVDKLPKTADGVPITPNMNLYSPCADYDFGCIAFRYEPDDFEIACRDVRGVDFELRAEQCYSTREAAEAARTEGRQ